jgi:uncharacterized protein involved in copper resistance
MLRVTTARRLLATLLAPWLAVFLTLPETLHSCAMHSVRGAAHAHANVHAAASVVAPAAPMAHHQMDGASMAGMSHDGTSAASHGAPDASSPAGTHCTCPEGCCTAAAPVALAPVSLQWVRELLGHQEPQYPRAQVAVASAADHRLPFANGPPARG